MGHHDVGRLQVAVRDLLAVHIVQGVHRLRGYPERKVGREPLLREERLQRVAVHLFHHDGSAHAGELLHGQRAADIGMLQQQADLKLLHYRLLIYGGEQVVRLQAFQHIALAIPRGGEKTRRARLGDIILLDVAKAFLLRHGVHGPLLVYRLGEPRREPVVRRADCVMDRFSMVLHKL